MRIQFTCRECGKMNEVDAPDMPTRVESHGWFFRLLHHLTSREYFLGARPRVPTGEARGQPNGGWFVRCPHCDVRHRFVPPGKAASGVPGAGSASANEP